MYHVPVQVGVTTFGGFEVEVVDPIADYLATLKEVFDFGMLKAFVTRSDFSMVFDAMNAVTGAFRHHTCNSCG
jgi:phosphoglucomutase